MHASLMSRLRPALKAFAWHLGISALVALIAGVLVFGVWFPYPFRWLAGGLHLFWILVGVDVICGPLLTLVLFKPSKSRRELTLDLSLVALIQMAALAYGLHSVALARPVALVYEVDRFVAVSQAQLDPEDIKKAPAEYQRFSWLSGPRLLGARAPKDGAEMLESVELSLNGKEPSVRPHWWQAYAQSVPQVKQRMKPLTELRERRIPAAQAHIDAALKRVGRPIEALFYLPLTSQKQLDGWVALLDEHASVVGYAPVDGF